MIEEASKGVPADPAAVRLVELSPLEHRLAELREHFPEAFADGDFDATRLLATLGAEGAELPQPRRFGLDWPGKLEAIHLLLLPGLGTLRPDRDTSMHFDSAEHTFITGDNLEVMKLLQKAYFGSFKMIYMDPPYNTGSDFIYKDDYRDPLRAYLRYSGQLTSSDTRVSSLLETDGRFHSRWLSMMLPRLFVARNLLAEDGVVFVSIDDHESHHLRMLMDEVFGSENFVCSFVWEKRYAPPPDTKDIGYVHENILCYRRSDAFSAALLPMTEQQKGRYKNPDADSRGAWKAADYTCRYTARERPTLFYPIRKRSSGFPEIKIEAAFEGGTLRVSVNQKTPLRKLALRTVTGNGKEEQHMLDVTRATQLFEMHINGAPRSISIAPEGPVLLQWPKTNRVWACSPGEHEKNEAEKRIWWPTDSEVPAKKRFLFEIRQGGMPMTLLKHEDVGHTDEATKELREYFPDVKVTPKPTRLLRHLLRIAGVQSGDLVLDCFAGTGTTAQAIIDEKEEGDIAAHFVLVQIPEPLKEDSRRTMADIARERALLRLKALPEDNASGLRSFSLTSSCFRSPLGDAPRDKDALAEQLRLLVHNVEDGRTEEDLLFEVLLKAGFRLTSPVQRIEAAGQAAYSVADGMLLICLERNITRDCLRALLQRSPQRVVCLDVAFLGNDQLKTNIVLEMRSHGIEFRTI